MPAEYEIDEARGRLEARYFGVLTPDEFRALADRVQVDPRLRADFDHLADFTDVTHFGLDAQAVADEVRRHLAADAQRADSPHRIAIAAPDDVAYGMSRIFSARRESERVRLGVFRSRPAAEAWLDAPPGTPPDELDGHA
ncbi:MAG: hypothetical protein V2J02_00285 [Pseudomonadales bacterium]|jgi:hypothetical protein|nr:hypothetical protein [Pseudomonadales bacterium]